MSSDNINDSWHPSMASMSKAEGGTVRAVPRLPRHPPPASAHAILPHHPLPLSSQVMLEFPRPLPAPPEGSHVLGAQGAPATSILIRGATTAACPGTELTLSVTRDGLYSIGQIAMDASAFIPPPVFGSADDGSSTLQTGHIEKEGWGEETKQPPSGISEVNNEPDKDL